MEEEGGAELGPVVEEEEEGEVILRYITDVCYLQGTACWPGEM